MSSSPINPFVAPADMRDIRAVRETVEREARIAELRAQDSALFRAELRSRMDRVETELLAAARDRATMLRHLEKLVVIPATERATLAPEDATLAPEDATWEARLGAWLARPATTRALLYGLAMAGIGATLSGCLAQPLARALLLGSP